MRKPERQALKEAFEQGANLTLVFHKRLAQISRDILKAGNLDGAGKSVAIYQKIAAFNESASSDPLGVICLTSTGLALWDMQATEESAEFTWDATGNVVQCLDLKKKILYYELTMANPIKRGTPIPLTFLLAESQDAVTIKLWLETFKQLYLKQYSSADSFPTPKIIINDRAQVLIQTALACFNNETFRLFNERAYRILTVHALLTIFLCLESYSGWLKPSYRNQDSFSSSTGYGTNADVQKTIPHACTAHIMKDSKILCHKSKLKKQEVKTIMMYCSVVLNSNTYEELKKSYQLFCVYFIHPQDTPQHRAAKEQLNAAVKTLGKIKKENVDDVIGYDEKYLQLHVVDEYDIHDIDKEEIDDDIKKVNQASQTWFSEEAMLNEFDSNIKTDMHQIYGSVWKQRTSVTSQDDTNKSSGTHVRTKSKTNMKDEESAPKAYEANLNPYETFILRFNKLYMATVHLWSNILLGDLDQYRTTDNVAAPGSLRQEIAKIQRTTGTSEKPGATKSRRLKELTERWSKKKTGHYQQYTKSIDHLIKMKMPEVMFYCDMKAVIMWENKDKTHGLENSVFKATTAVKVLQKSMLNIDPTVTLPDHLDDLCTLLRRAITNPNTVKKGAIQSVITGIRKHIVSLNKTGAFHLVKFIEQFILPIISTNVQMTVVLETTFSAVYRTNDDQYASITLRNTNKYICEGEGEGGFGIGEC
ncbi:unnamed protein product [Didymodactylos carnosus]|uniref:Uncharacterized protein n=1 Tax=Didymodactylos carnosus TaxID=1234261 RepID=A0A814NVS2_9BILA|nr:unnamed protein product [Didymodactylos carnosus]CAF3862324.1 unnamed protein product [Didymodactylos carnosus]